MIGVCGLFFFIVGYARARNDLFPLISAMLSLSLPPKTILLHPSPIPMPLSTTPKAHQAQAHQHKSNSPRRATLLRRLTKQKPHLLQRLRKRIFARHLRSLFSLRCNWLCLLFLMMFSRRRLKLLAQPRISDAKIMHQC